MSASAGPNIVEDGLVLHLDASDNKSYPGSGSVWYDRSGNDYDSTLNNSPTYTGSSFSLNGAGQGVNTTYDITNKIGVSISVWVKLLSLPSTYRYIVDQSPGVVGFGVRWNNATTIQIFAYNSSGSVSTVNYNSTFNVDEWMNFVFVINTDKLKIYRNKELVIDFDASGLDIIRYAESNLVFGYGIGVGSYLNAEISSGLIYEKELSPEEVLQNYNATKSRFGL